MTSEPTQTSTVYETLRAEIMSGTLAADSKLKTRHLSARLDVGLSPIREALSRLSSEGWVVQNDRRGFSVVPVSVEELWDLHRARCMMNEIALRESIRHGDVAWEEHVLLSYIRISRLQRPADVTATDQIEHWNVQHRAFHSSLIMACRSNRLVRSCEQLFDEIERYRRIGLNYGTPRSKVGDEHREIADAAVARDAETAARLLNDHFTRTVEQVEQALRDQHAQKEG